MKRLIIALGIVALWTSLTACAGGASAPTTTAAPSAASITIADFTFSGPGSVAAGQTVTVTNNDTVAHTWTSDEGVFDSGRLAPGDTFSFVFDEPGEYAFHCSIHPQMKGSITVTG